ncbi:hypothetical protein Tco_0556553 [Tanacetum coccineum]
MPPRRLKKKSVKRLVEKRVAKAIEEYEKSRANLDSAGTSLFNGNGRVWSVKALDIEGGASEICPRQIEIQKDGARALDSDSEGDDIKGITTIVFHELDLLNIYFSKLKPHLMMPSTWPRNLVKQAFQGRETRLVKATKGSGKITKGTPTTITPTTTTTTPQPKQNSSPSTKLEEKLPGLMLASTALRVEVMWESTSVTVAPTFLTIMRRCLQVSEVPKNWSSRERLQS